MNSFQRKIASMALLSAGVLLTTLLVVMPFLHNHQPDDIQPVNCPAHIIEALLVPLVVQISLTVLIILSDTHQRILIVDSIVRTQIDENTNLQRGPPFYPDSK
jgi:hypothetical protein